MSADNYIGVVRTEDNEWFIDPYGNMSMLSEDCQYGRKNTRNSDHYLSRADALVAAHDLVKQANYPIEYGVIELEPPPPEHCGKCFVCINQRGIVADDVTRCDKCGEPIAEGDWMTITSEGTFHNRCERG